MIALLLFLALALSWLLSGRDPLYWLIELLIWIRAICAALWRTLREGSAVFVARVPGEQRAMRKEFETR